MEDYPQSRAELVRQRVDLLQTPATATIKVSLDEAIVIDRRANAELMTDGLNGCVAVALKSGDRIGMTHVFSDALSRFDEYREPLRAFAREVANGGTITEAYIVHNGNALEQGYDQTLPQMIRQTLDEQGLVRAGGFVVKACNGCTLSEHGLFLKDNDNPLIFNSGGHTNGALAHLDHETATSLRRGILRTGDLFDPAVTSRRSGYQGHSEIPEGAISARAHRLDAYSVPPLSEAERPAPDLGQSIRMQLTQLGVTSTFSALNRGVRDIKAALDQNGFTEARLEATADRQHLRAIAGDRSLEFDVADGKITLSAGPSQTASPAASSSPADPDAKPLTLYEQAIAALEPHRAGLDLQHRDQAVLAAAEIASQANQDGLTSISRLETGTTAQGAPALIAHQDGPSERQSQPIAIETLQRHAGVETASHAPSHDGPDKHHFTLM